MFLLHLLGGMLVVKATLEDSSIPHGRRGEKGKVGNLKGFRGESIINYSPDDLLNQFSYTLDIVFLLPLLAYENSEVRGVGEGVHPLLPFSTG